jgi:hypothetical protein
MTPTQTPRAAPWLALAAALTPALALAGGTEAFTISGSTFTSEASFLSAAGATQIESFETVAPRLPGTGAVTAPLLTLSTDGATLGVQNGADAPSTGFGSFATDGLQYVLVYAPGVATGQLQLTLNGPTTAVGFYLTDIGEAPGTVTLRTDAGAFTSATVVATYPPTLGSGNVQFFGLVQTEAFTQLFLTVSGVDEAYGIDKVYVGVVPEPGPSALMLAGLAGVGLLVRRRTRG